MNFDTYKNRLTDYLSLKGIHGIPGIIRCFNPAHNDRNPSCQVQENHFHCYSCGCDGDIYDAVELLEGITDKKEQYKFLEETFGGSYTPEQVKEKPEEKKQKKTFIADADSVRSLESYLSGYAGGKEYCRNYLNEHASAATHGEVNAYSDELSEKMLGHFVYWPGYDIAEHDLGWKVLRGSGIPGKNPNTGRSSWAHSGVVNKLGSGYKLRYYQDGESKKVGTTAWKAFPFPYPLNGDETDIIIVEGEIDAIAMVESGIEHVFSAGSTQGLTKELIAQYLVKDTLQSVTVFYDNDDAGKEAAGILPPRSARAENTPVKLQKAGFTGSIKIAAVERLNPYKDPDEAILHGRLDLVMEAIENATEYQAKEQAKKEKAEKPAASEKQAKPEQIKGTLTEKEISALLKKLPISQLEDTEVQPFISAIFNATTIDEISLKPILKNWGATERQLNRKHLQDGFYLATVAKHHELSYYYINKIEQATISKEELEKYVALAAKPIVDIDYAMIDDNLDMKKELKTFIYKRGEKSAANLLARILNKRFIYVETEKKYYFFNGLVWQREPDVSGIAYNILNAILMHYTKECSAEDQTRLKAINSALNKIEEYRFCTTVMKALSEKPNIFREQITFDGPQIQETLTLQDCVMDFSEKEITFRDAKPEEYRRKILPYTYEQVVQKGTPDKFIKFMKSNFRNDDTLETLMYFLSLIPSRRAQFKVGGIFVGIAHTGKTTTMKVIQEIYPDMTTPIPRELIMSQGRLSSSSGPNPYMARLEGMGAGISDETKRNDTLNGALWKQLTGGGMLTARGMYAQPRDFMPTSQIIILTNYSPKFDGKDQATIDRMVVVPFSIQHKKGEEGTMEEDELIDMLRPEFPMVVRLFAEYYIKLKYKHKSKIPLSKECEAYKADYVENQETDLDRFVNDNIEFIKDENCWVKLKDVYQRFCMFNDIELDEYGKPLDKEAWSQSKFTRYLRGDYNEIRIKQRKINGYPEQIVLNMRLKEWVAPEKDKDLQLPQVNTQRSFSDDADDEEDPFD